MTNELTAADG